MLDVPSLAPAALAALGAGDTFAAPATSAAPENDGFARRVRRDDHRGAGEQFRGLRRGARAARRRGGTSPHSNAPPAIPAAAAAAAPAVDEGWGAFSDAPAAQSAKPEVSKNDIMNMFDAAPAMHTGMGMNTGMTSGAGAMPQQQQSFGVHQPNMMQPQGFGIQQGMTPQMQQQNLMQQQGFGMQQGMMGGQQMPQMSGFAQHPDDASNLQQQMMMMQQQQLQQQQMMMHKGCPECPECREVCRWETPWE